MPASQTDADADPEPQAQAQSRQPQAQPQSEYQRAREKFNSKANSEYFDPCQDAASRSLRCLQRNPTDRDLCSDYFQAYRDCKKRWLEERKEERRKQGAWW